MDPDIICQVNCIQLGFNTHLRVYFDLYALYFNNNKKTVCTYFKEGLKKRRKVWDIL